MSKNLKTEFSYSKPPTKIYFVLGLFGAIIVIAAMILFWFEVRIILLSGTGIFILYKGTQLMLYIQDRRRINRKQIQIDRHEIAMLGLEYKRQRYLVIGHNAIDVENNRPMLLTGSKSNVVEVAEYQLLDAPRKTLQQIIQTYRHIALLGQTGSGKSSQLAHILVMMQSLYPDAKTVLMDSHIIKANWPNCDYVLWNYDDMAAWVSWLVDDFEERCNPFSDYTGQRYIILMDEYPAIALHFKRINKDLLEDFARLLREGWKFGLHFIIGTQSHLVEDSGMNSLTRTNFTWINLSIDKTRQNIGELVSSRKFQLIEEIELAGPWHSDNMDWFNEGLKPELPEIAQDTELDQFCRLINDEGMSKSQASQLIFNKPFAGTSHVERLNKALLLYQKRKNGE